MALSDAVRYPVAVTSAPLLSVVAGTRNRPQCLQRFVGSVLEYTSHPFELLVGDASDRAPRYRSHDPRVRVFDEPEPLGYVRGYNALFRRAAGRFVVFLNDDLEVRPGWSEQVLGTFERSPGVDLACLPMAEPGEPEPFLLLYGDLPYACFGAVRREVGERLGWFDERYRFYAADPDFSLRLLRAGRRLAPVFGAPLFHHRMPGEEREHNRAHFESDNRTLERRWRRRLGAVRRRYLGSCYGEFRGLETRWCQGHRTPALEIPAAPGQSPANPRHPHQVRVRPRRWAWWRRPRRVG